MWLILWKQRLWQAALWTLWGIVGICAGMALECGTQRADLIHEKGWIALIIDDFGNHGDGTEEILKMGIPVTAAVMPFLPFSESDAELAHRSGQEVLLHLPMEPEHGQARWLGPGAITSHLTQEEIRSRVQKGLDNVKWAIGINNHMGSKAMQSRKVVETVLEVTQERNLCFVDSRTTAKTVAPEVASQFNLVYLGRDIFLELRKDKRSIIRQLHKLAELAKKQGYAIGIGHVGHDGGTVTVEAIRETYPELIREGIGFTSLSEMRQIIIRKQKGDLTAAKMR